MREGARGVGSSDEQIILLTASELRAKWMALGVHLDDIFLFGAKHPDLHVGSFGMTLYPNFRPG